MILTKLKQQGLIHPPKWLDGSTAYLTVMGSVAYGVSADASDVDVYGFCIPPKHIIFPHTAGVIHGFGDQGERFDQWQEQHIKSQDGKAEYDFAVFSILKYFQLCMDNNPNMLNSLFTPRRCVLHSTQVGEMVREARRDFLHKGAWHKFKGYAYSQMAKIRNKVQADSPARAASIAEHGYDLKYAYHTVRLLNEVEQILVEGDLDIERNREQLKDIRRGEWSLEQLETYFTEKERALEAVYAASTIPVRPDERKIKALLFDCLETRFGSISEAVTRPTDEGQLVRELEAVLAKYR